MHRTEKEIGEHANTPIPMTNLKEQHILQPLLEDCAMSSNLLMVISSFGDGTIITEKQASHKFNTCNTSNFDCTISIKELESIWKLYDKYSGIDTSESADTYTIKYSLR